MDKDQIPAADLPDQITLPGFEAPDRPKLSAIDILKNIVKNSNVLSNFLTLNNSEALTRAIASLASLSVEDRKKISELAESDQSEETILPALFIMEQRNQLDAIYDSLYMQAIGVVEPMQANYKDPAAIDFYTDKDLRPENPITVKEEAVIYFFGMHPELDPTANAILSNEQMQELQEIFTRLDAFYLLQNEGGAAGQGEDTNKDTFILFVEHENPPEPSKRRQAEENKAITTIGNRLLTPSSPKFQDALTTNIRSNIGIFKKDQDGKRQFALGVNTPFLQALLKLSYLDLMSGHTGDTMAYFPSIAREMGLEMNRKQDSLESTTSRAAARAEYINKTLADIDSIWGVLPESRTEYKLVAVHAYDPDTETFYFQSPYFKELLAQAAAEENKAIEAGKHYYNWKCDLLHASAVSERNPAAVEMATRILVGVQQRGLKPDAQLKQNKNKTFADEKEVTYSIKCAGLIQDCPQIREKLKALPNASRRTEYIKRAFTAMYKILTDKSDLTSFYKDLVITAVIPTAKTLNAEIVITHHGQNPNYRRPFIQTSEDTTPTAQ